MADKPMHISTVVAQAILERFHVTHPSHGIDPPDRVTEDELARLIQLHGEFAEVREVLNELPDDKQDWYAKWLV